MIYLYNTLLLFALVLASPILLIVVAVSPRLRRDFTERLKPLPRSGPGTVWLHAASVGEVEAAAALVEALVERGLPVVVTTLTLTGRARMRARVPGVRARLAPLDLPNLVRRSLVRARVAVLVLIETELWPNTLWAARQEGCEVLIASGRISDRSYPRYRRLAALFRPLLRRVHIAARSEQDRERFRALGVPVDRAVLGGDLKLDRPTPGEPSDELIAALGPGPFLLGGSTHPGEEEALLHAWQSLRADGASHLRLLLAPRHPERVPQVRAMVERNGSVPGLRSEGAAERDVVILDTLGELPTVYALVDLVFAGGTLAHVGGHNLIEPVQAGKVIVHGPHTENQRSHERLLAPLGVLRRVEGAAELGQVLAELWSDPDRNAPALRARGALERHRGATQRTLDLVLQLRDRASDRA